MCWRRRRSSKGSRVDSPRQTLSHDERRERAFKCAPPEILLTVKHSLAARSGDLRWGPRLRLDFIVHNKAWRAINRPATCTRTLGVECPLTVDRHLHASAM